MIRLHSRNIDEFTTDHLQTEQNFIDAAEGPEEKYNTARSRWDSKLSSKNGKKAFEKIKEKLREICSGAEICVYCEHNEITDIEHIFPKRLYPAMTFKFDNYVLACGKCNTIFKRDHFSIFDPQQSTTEIDVTPQRNVYSEPPNADALFIDLRSENPMDLIELDFLAKTFHFVEKNNVGTREFKRAKYTIEILGLNKRADLVEHRKGAYIFYRSLLEKYVKVMASVDMVELSACTDEIFEIDENADFESEKSRIKNLIETHVKKHNHPTVWKEMIHQRADLPTVNRLFIQVPETLTW